MSVLDKIIDLFKTSAVTQGAITIICLLATFALLFNGMVPPDWLTSIDLLIVGFFFGGKLGVAQGRLDIQKENAQ
jgi:hypothetical protein